MSEYGVLWTAVGSMGGLTVTTGLYGLGGRNQKLWRRIGAAITLSLTLNVAALLMGSWHWIYAAVAPLLFGALTLPYGGDTAGEKVLKRTVYAGSFVAIGGLIVWFKGEATWMILIPQAVTAGWSIWLGVKNPLPAAAEEVFVCVSLMMWMLAYPFVG